MAWLLSVLAALPEYLVLVPSTYFGQLTDVCDSSYRESSACFWPPWAPSHIQPVHTHTRTCTCTHIHIHTRIYTIFKKQKLSLLLLYLCVRVCMCAQMCQGTCGQSVELVLSCHPFLGSGDRTQVNRLVQQIPLLVTQQASVLFCPMMLIIAF